MVERNVDKDTATELYLDIMLSEDKRMNGLKPHSSVGETVGGGNSFFESIVEEVRYYYLIYQQRIIYYCRFEECRVLGNGFPLRNFAGYKCD